MAHGTRPPHTVYDRDDELGRLNASLKYLVEAADNSSEYQRKFISNISHDFRSPLTSIKGYVEAILDGTIPPELQDRYLHIVLDETNRLNKLTEGLLLLNTFDDNAIYLEMSEFNIVDVIRHTVDSFEGTCKKKNLSVIISAQEFVPVYADMSRIQQVLYNLLDNAIKFSPAEKEIWITVTTRKKSVFVSVKDFGVGISRENLSGSGIVFIRPTVHAERIKKESGLASPLCVKSFMPTAKTSMLSAQKASERSLFSRLICLKMQIRNEKYPEAVMIHLLPGIYVSDSFLCLTFRTFCRISLFSNL